MRGCRGVLLHIEIKTNVIKILIRNILLIVVTEHHFNFRTETFVYFAEGRLANEYR